MSRMKLFLVSVVILYSSSLGLSYSESHDFIASNSPKVEFSVTCGGASLEEFFLVGLAISGVSTILITSITWFLQLHGYVRGEMHLTLLRISHHNRGYKFKDFAKSEKMEYNFFDLDGLSRVEKIIKGYKW
jgi:hypothetical protein